MNIWMPEYMFICTKLWMYKNIRTDACMDIKMYEYINKLMYVYQNLWIND